MLSRAIAFLILLAGTASAAGAASRPVVVELFTSEGCSSCPPADALLTQLSRSRADVLPLAFHVTYWNGIGWKDPYSLTAATERQARYGERFGDGSYTPEMVVDGRKGFVGSDRAAAEAAIASAHSSQTAEPDVEVGGSGSEVAITVGAGHGTARVVLIGYDPEHRTSVGRGENAGRTLVESNIVRSMRILGQWTGSALSLTAAAPAGERVAVILEASDGTIIGAARRGASS
jgi:hypothetical protein